MKNKIFLLSLIILTCYVQLGHTQPNPQSASPTTIPLNRASCTLDAARNIPNGFTDCKIFRWANGPYAGMSVSTYNNGPNFTPNASACPPTNNFGAGFIQGTPRCARTQQATVEAPIILPADRTHILRVRPARNIAEPGEWEDCQVFGYSSLMAANNARQRNFHLISSSSPDGIIRISPDPTKCPAGGYYLKGELISPNHIQVGQTRYTINLTVQIIAQTKNSTTLPSP